MSSFRAGRQACTRDFAHGKWIGVQAMACHRESLLNCSRKTWKRSRKSGCLSRWRRIRLSWDRRGPPRHLPFLPKKTAVEGDRPPKVSDRPNAPWEPRAPTRNLLPLPNAAVEGTALHSDLTNLNVPRRTGIPLGPPRATSAFVSMPSRRSAFPDIPRPVETRCLSRQLGDAVPPSSAFERLRASVSLSPHNAPAPHPGVKNSTSRARSPLASAPNCPNILAAKPSSAYCKPQMMRKHSRNAQARHRMA